MDILRGVYNLDNNTSLEFLNPKTVYTVDKDRFLVCKQLMLKNADDEEFAEFLDIPVNKVKYFKYKMLMWENSIRARRKAEKSEEAKRLKNPLKRKISPEDRFKKARDLIGKNYSTNEISKILKISERSVTRFKKRMREEKRKLKAEGKFQFHPDDEDTSLKYLSESEKLNKAKGYIEKGLSLSEIAAICKVSERTVRRWKERLSKNPELTEEEDEETSVEDPPPREQEETVNKKKRQRKIYYDRDKVKYAVELINNGLSNKEISMFLELSIANVRKLKSNIINGTLSNIIDDSQYHYSKSNSDPLDGADDLVPLPASCKRKPKRTLSDRDMHITRILRDKGLRTMDIAKLVNISERSVTRLLTKSKNIEVHEYSIDILDEVKELLRNAEDIVINLPDVQETTENTNEDKEDEGLEEVEEEVDPPSSSFEQNFISKSRIGMDLIQMNVKPLDICKMLDVTLKQVETWRKILEVNEAEEAEEHYIIEEIEVPKLEEIL